jgi:biopolymer transport protein ExbD
VHIRRNTKLLIEPPSAATGDIVFNLIIFFLVCASSQPDSGRRQDIPRSETQKEKQQQSDNLEVALTRTGVTINGAEASLDGFRERIGGLLGAKKRPEDRVVVVKSAKDTPYRHWILITGWIEEAGGTITLQLQEEREVTVQ